MIPTPKWAFQVVEFRFISADDVPPDAEVVADVVAIVKAKVRFQKELDFAHAELARLRAEGAATFSQRIADLRFHIDNYEQRVVWTPERTVLVKVPVR